MEIGDRTDKAYLLSRRTLVKQTCLMLAGFHLPSLSEPSNTKQNMKYKNFDVIIIGGSYSGLAAGLALGRAQMTVLIIDGGNPCNRQTPYSHNFLTQDGSKPAEIALLARRQVQKYDTVEFLDATAVKGRKTVNGQFEILIGSGEKFRADKLVFATGIKDILPGIPGFSECWGISVLHCPFCHGWEVRNESTGILAKGQDGYELCKLISNWTNELLLFTDGESTLTPEQLKKLETRHIKVVETKVARLENTKGYLQNVVLSDSTHIPLKAVYSRVPFVQSCLIPQSLGCELTEEGYLKVDPSMETTVDGVFACGDNVSRMRTVANAAAMGTAAGISVTKKILFEEF